MNEDGMSKINEAAILRDNWNVIRNIESPPAGAHKIHLNCRTKFNNSTRLGKLKTSMAKNINSDKKRLRSATNKFCWKDNCYLYGKGLGDLPNVERVNGFEYASWK